MRTSLVLIAVGVLAIAFGACSCPGPVCTPGTVVPPANTVWMEHSHAKITAVQPLSAGCEDLKIEAVDVEVMDPQNRAVPATANANPVLQQYYGGQIQVTAEFDTGEPGWYHVLLRLEPSISVIQFPVLVTRDQSDAGVISVSGSCARPMVTRNGTAICDGTPKNTAPEFTATELAVTGNVVWTWNRNELARWEDVGNHQFVKSPDAGYLKSSTVKLVGGVDGGELFAVTSSNVERYAVRNGELVQLASVPIGQSVAMDFGIASANTVYLVAMPDLPTADSVNQVCPYSLEGDVLTAGLQCQEFTGIPVGVGDGALWIRDPTSVRAYTPADGRLLTASSSQLPDRVKDSVVSNPGPSAPLVVPAQGPSWLLLRLEGNNILFDQYATAPFFNLYSSTPTAIAETNGSTTRLVPLQ